MHSLTATPCFPPALATLRSPPSFPPTRSVHLVDLLDQDLPGLQHVLLRPHAGLRRLPRPGVLRQLLVLGRYRLALEVDLAERGGRLTWMCARPATQWTDEA